MEAFRKQIARARKCIFGGDGARRVMSSNRERIDFSQNKRFSGWEPSHFAFPFAFSLPPEASFRRLRGRIGAGRRAKNQLYKRQEGTTPRDIIIQRASERAGLAVLRTGSSTLAVTSELQN